jgi:mannose-1-phosphate guanylyltransferase / mannose-6-phosphate isomerase
MIIPVVLSGGTGSRLWPASRQQRPKPFMQLQDGHSLLQKTYQRAMNVPHSQHIITVSNHDYYFQSKDELHALNPTDKKFTFLSEPMAQNTAPAIALCTLLVQDLIHDQAVLLVMPADHQINNQNQFNASVLKAIEIAQQNQLVCFGIIPNRAETGYGYIEYCPTNQLNIAYKVQRFHEKPQRIEAESFLEQGNYLWNSGIFCFTPRTLLQALSQHAPDLYQAALNCWRLTKDNIDLTRDQIHIHKESFLQLPALSIDYAIMEKTNNLMVIPAEFGWSDLGSWDSIGALIAPDQLNNRTSGEVMLFDSDNNSIHNLTNRMIAGIGLKDLVIVDTPDALLISHAARVQEVGKIVNHLKASDHKAYKQHQTVYRPWGHYTVLEQGNGYKVKRIVVKPGARLSLQAHQHRSEHWVVISGIAEVEHEQEKFQLTPQQSTYIPSGHKHRLSNFGEQDLIIIEIQTGSYLGEDDIIRFDDVYERTEQQHSV